MTPKSLLRSPDARSRLEEFTSGSFRETLDDHRVDDPERVRRILLTTGKIAFQLAGERDKRDAEAAIVRVEQLYPFPREQLFEIFERYPRATEVVWIQDEPENMGAWWFIYSQLKGTLPDRLTLEHVARAESGSPATGSPTVHEQEAAEINDRALSL